MMCYVNENFGARFAVKEETNISDVLKQDKRSTFSIENLFPQKHLFFTRYFVLMHVEMLQGFQSS